MSIKQEANEIIALLECSGLVHSDKGKIWIDHKFSKKANLIMAVVAQNAKSVAELNNLGDLVLIEGIRATFMMRKLPVDDTTVLRCFVALNYLVGRVTDVKTKR